MDSTDLRHIYSSMLVGRLPCGTANPQQVVLTHVFSILGTKQVHMHWHLDSGYVYFLAVESTLFSSLRRFETPLINVLPGLSGNRGEGVYLLELNGFSVALVQEGGSLQLWCNSPDLIADQVSDLNLTVYPLSNEHLQPLNSAPQLILGLSERLARVANVSAFAVSVLGASVFVAANAFKYATAAQEEITVTSRNIEDALNKELDRLNVQQPLARQIARIQKVSSTVVRAGGWVESYTLTGEKNEKFELVLPSWVSPDYIDALGPDVTTDLRDLEGLLSVRKSNKEN